MIKTLAAAIALAAALLATPAQAAEPHVVPARYESPVVCVSADGFSIMHSGWKIKQELKVWNAVQASVRFTLKYEVGCDVLILHVYDAADGHGGYTDNIRWIQAGEPREDGLVWFRHGSDIYLNDHYGNRDTKCGALYLFGHEVGHAIGLDHTTGRSSIMSYGNDIGKHCGIPSQADVDAVTALYTL